MRPTFKAKANVVALQSALSRETARSTTSSAPRFAVDGARATRLTPRSDMTTPPDDVRRWVLYHDFFRGNKKEIHPTPALRLAPGPLRRPPCRLRGTPSWRRSAQRAR